MMIYGTSANVALNVDEPNKFASIPFRLTMFYNISLKWLMILTIGKKYNISQQFLLIKNGTTPTNLHHIITHIK